MASPLPVLQIPLQGLLCGCTSKRDQNGLRTDHQKSLELVTSAVAVPNTLPRCHQELPHSWRAAGRSNG